MIERVIENWLDNTTEREYELPFCQILTSTGHKILSRSTHGPGEFGKDIISRDARGSLHAYQLKTGNINTKYWREIRGEIEELVCLPIQHPNIRESARFTPHLITNGNVTTDVKQQISQFSKHWLRTSGRTLQISERESLLSEFKQLHESILPVAPVDFERFLSLFLRDKRDAINKGEFSKFLESIIQPSKASVGPSQIRRAFAGTAVLAAYVLSGFRKATNYCAEAEGWTMLIANLLCLAERSRARQSLWQMSLDLCIEGWEEACEGLVKEALSAKSWSEGDRLTDWVVRPFRETILRGWLSCFALYLAAGNKNKAMQDEILHLINRKNSDSKSPQAMFWGESAAPYFYAQALFLFSRGHESMSCSIVEGLVRLICGSNGVRGRFGIPDPYYGPQSVLSAATLGKDVFAPRQSFAGRSFALRAFVEFLARRERKQTLKRLWHCITGVDTAEFVPKNKSDFYRWRCSKGSLDTRRWKRPEQWETLLATATSIQDDQSLLTTRFKSFVFPFILVFPHRFIPRLAHFAEKVATETT